MSNAAFRSRYRSAFRVFAREPTETALRSAYELSREAVRTGVSALEIVDVHHEILADAVATVAAEDVRSTISGAGEFLVESLAAFEMVRLGFSDARLAAFVERRNARMMRQLSALLADESLATSDREALQEVLQLVAEHAREVTDARSGVVHVLGAGAGEMEARSDANGDDTWSDVFQPGKASAGSGVEKDAIYAPLRSLEGTALGYIEVEGKRAGEFSSDDEAVLAQVAEMTAAAVERSLAYR